MQNSQHFQNTLTSVKKKLCEQIKNNQKCILVIGTIGCGKSTLIKYLSGVGFALETNQQEMPVLVEKSQQQNSTSQIQINFIQSKMTILESVDQNTKKINIIEMPFVPEYNQDNHSHIMYQIFLVAYIWNIVMDITKDIKILLVIETQSIINHDKLTNFIEKWYSIINMNDESVLEKINRCTSIILTKSQYQDDIETLQTLLGDLAQNQSEKYDVLGDAKEKNRFYCFLSAQSQKGQGAQLLERILSQGSFENFQQNKLIQKDLRHTLDIFMDISGMNNIQQIPKYKQLLSLYLNSNQQQQQEQQQQNEGEIEEEEEIEASIDSKIKRLYIPTPEQPDPLVTIKQNAKRNASKDSNVKEMQLTSREDIKNLLSAFDKEPQNRLQNIEKLANIFINYEFYQAALETLMDLDDPQQLYLLLTKHYFKYVKASEDKIFYLQYITEYLIYYLEYKSTIYSNYDKARQYWYCLQICYDFLAESCIESAQQFADIMAAANQVPMPIEQQSVILEDGADSITTLLNPTRYKDNIKDMQHLQYLNLSKADIMEKINHCNEKIKKNSQLFTEIKKYL